jgi:hypothetical protein
MTMAEEHLRFAAIARERRDEPQRLKHLKLAEEAQEECDKGNCICATRCKPIGNGFVGWCRPLAPVGNVAGTFDPDCAECESDPAACSAHGIKGEPQ